MKTLFSLLALMLLSSCALPESAVKTGSPRPTLMVKGAPADSTLVVDGLQIGPAVQFDGNPKTLIVEEGVHQVEIYRGNKVVHAEKAYVSNGESRTITINAGAQ